LSQFLIDMRRPGIGVRPLADLTGEEHFNEVSFEDVVLSRSDLIGVEGEGWAQAMAELAFERSGPERFLSSIQALVQLIRVVSARRDEESCAVVGRLVASLVTLRKMSLSVAGALQAGRDPMLEASVVKDLGANFEQSLPETVQALLGAEADESGSDLEQVLARLIRMAPAYSLRGGTREILRGIIARGLGLR